MSRRRKHGRYRICRLQAEPLEQAAVWIERMRSSWEERFDALDDYLENNSKEEQP